MTPDGAPGVTGNGGFKAELGRYHLYVSLACPWAHRTLIFRSLKGLAGIIPHSVVHWYLGVDGWTFEDGPGVVPDPIQGARYLYEVYKAASAVYTGRVTRARSVGQADWRNRVERSPQEIIRMMNSAFDEVGAKAGDYYPEALQIEDR